MEMSVFGTGPDAELLARYAEAGIDRVVFGVPPAGADEVLGLLDLYADLGSAIT
jgi:hypothetical protein